MKALCCLVIGVITACSARSNPAENGRVVAPHVLQVGRIDHPLIRESSGLQRNSKNPELFWTHNDGGGRKQVLYGITRQGRSVAEFWVTGALLEDWEDISGDGRGHLFLGDIGNNEARRREIAVHQIDEPDVTAAKGGSVKITRTWRLRFPQRPFDCESLVVWGDQGYVISKVFNDARAELYRFSLTNTGVQTLERILELKIDSPVTGADIAPDGSLLGVVAKNGAYVFKIHGDPVNASTKPHHTKLKDEHIEACAFVPDGLLATAESREIYLFTDEAFIPKRKKATK